MREDERALLALHNGLDLLGLAFAHRNLKYCRTLRTEVVRAKESGPVDHLFERGLAVYRLHSSHGPSGSQ